jgi:SagB-type dehydrogenase family enzyme
VQHWIRLPGLGRFALKTSPSGGALHPLEAYVLARRIAGVAPGLYHYAADTHQLELLKRGATRRQIGRYLPGQPWYRSAAAIVFFTAVFPRMQWKYEYSRAYRAVLTESGHVCQTFCLVATWLGLAPFSTLALADSRVERDLGLDGISESVLYAAGVGARPRGKSWAPFPNGVVPRRYPGYLATVASKRGGQLR